MPATDRPLSKKAFEKLSKVIPGGVNSPVRSFHDLEMSPLVVESGSGCEIVDLDGNEYIDYCMSWGALIHGHAHPHIVEAAVMRLKKGSSFGITTTIEEKLASKITKHVPSCEKVRMVGTGTEATMTAVRLARGYTKRSLVIKFSGCYHGHADCFLLKAGSGVTRLAESSSSGIPHEMVASTFCLPFNDCEAFVALMNRQEIQENLACVIVEPIAANMGVVAATHEFLELLRRRTLQCGAVLIFDEVITGFRVGLGGAQELYGITPDLTCFGKVIGGGFPAAAFGGKACIMDLLAPLGPVYQAGTLSGNPVAMEAGIAALELCEEAGFFENLHKKASIITEPVKDFIEEKELPFCLHAQGSLFTLFCGPRLVQNQDDSKSQDFDQFKKLFHYLFDNGVYMPPSPYEAWFISSAHTQRHLEKTRDLILEFLALAAPKTMCSYAVL